MDKPVSDQVHAKATKALNAAEDLVTEIAKQAPDPKQADELTAPIKQCVQIFRKVVEVAGKTEAPPEPRPTIESATDEMVAENKAQPAV